MKNKFLICLIYTVFLLFPYSSTANDNVHNDRDYFEVFEDIQKVPQGHKPINPLNTKETRILYNYLKLHHINPIGPYEDIKEITKDGQMVNNYYDVIVIYKGDFDNSKHEIYLMITQGGTAHVSSYYFFSLKNNKYIPIKFDDIVLSNFNITEMNNFYWWHAKPIAIKKNNKTYLRFMEGPGGGMNYDSFALCVCTYLWHNNQIGLIQETKKKGSKVTCMKTKYNTHTK